MARPEVTGRRPVNVAQPAAATIPEFCQQHRISVSFYFKLRALGLGPKEMRALNKVLISNEAAAVWRREREQRASSA